MDEPDEVLDLVDGRDEKTGTIIREDVMKLVAGVPGFVRAANAFIINARGELWVPRRTAQKKIAPSGLDFSVGEHVQTGETYEAAIVRGFAEELGLSITSADVAYVGKVTPEQSGVPYFEVLFLYRADNVPPYKQDDFTSYGWLMPAELQAKLIAGEPAKKGLAPSIELLQSYIKGKG